MSSLRREEQVSTASKRPESLVDPRHAVLLVGTALVLSGMLADIQTTTLLAPLVTAVATSEHLTLTEVGWVVNAGSIGAAVAVSFTGRLGDTYGHRRVLLTTIVIAMLGTLLAILANSFWPIIVGRFFMGTALSIPLAWGMVRPRASETQVRTVSLVLSTVTALFTPCAVSLGGAFLIWGLPWQTALWMVFAVMAAVLVVTLLSPETPASARSRIPVDWAGAIGLGLWATFILVALTEGPSLGWGSPLVIGFGLGGLALFMLWILQQRLAKVPLMSFERMDVRQTIIGFTGLGFMGVGGSALFIGIPNMLQTPVASGWGLGESPFRSALPLLASAVTAVLGAASVIRLLIPRFGPKLVLVGAAIGSLACWLGIAFAHTSYWEFWLWCAVFGVTVVTTWGAGFWLVAASTRDDNTAITFGMENVIVYLCNGFAAAAVFDAIRPGASGYTPEGSWVRLFIGVSVFVAVMAVIWAFLAPKTVRDQRLLVDGEYPAVPVAVPPTEV